MTYKGFTITERTFQIRGSGRWTVDLVLGRLARTRAFSSPLTFATREEAVEGCREFAQRIIDGKAEQRGVIESLRG